MVEAAGVEPDNLLFGGGGYDSAGVDGGLNDLWEFSPSTGMWTWFNGPNSQRPLVLGSLTGCGGGGSTTSTITVTATSAMVQQSTTVTLTLN